MTAEGVGKGWDVFPTCQPAATPLCVRTHRSLKNMYSCVRAVMGRLHFLSQKHNKTVSLWTKTARAVEMHPFFFSRAGDLRSSTLYLARKKRCKSKPHVRPYGLGTQNQTVAKARNEIPTVLVLRSPVIPKKQQSKIATSIVARVRCKHPLYK